MLDQKIAVVTGAGGGIGRAIALAMAKAGALIVVNDLGGATAGGGRSSAPAEETAHLIEAAGGTAVTSIDSVAEWDSASRIVETAISAFGGVDIVVNNAGILRWAPFQETSPEDWDVTLAVHLSGSFYVSRAAAPHLINRGGGAYVHISSTSGLMGHYNQAPYCAAKAGILGLSKAIALDLKSQHIRSNCIAPFAFTRMATSANLTEERKAIVEKLKPEQIAPLAVFLAADAAAHVSGQAFTVRGNEIMLMHQGLPKRSVHRGEGWSAQTIADHGMRALAPDFIPLGGFNEILTWEPI
jgi:NAD(P)-dependent dehydrogenase (short-subunit alcohol dehydrogenase family)